jgi:hypothetical protein
MINIAEIRGVRERRTVPVMVLTSEGAGPTVDSPDGASAS